jgi:hypothetical protein
VAAGTHVPVQAPAAHAYGHIVGEPHVPSEAQVWTALPTHSALPGVHTPVHAPFTHAWLVHATTALQLPVALQVWTPSPEHCTAPGAHTPVQLPAEQA